MRHRSRRLCAAKIAVHGVLPTLPEVVTPQSPLIQQQNGRSGPCSSSSVAAPEIARDGLTDSHNWRSAFVRCIDRRTARAAIRSCTVSKKKVGDVVAVVYGVIKGQDTDLFRAPLSDTKKSERLRERAGHQRGTELSPDRK